ncbi:MAG: hypothetical protein ACJ73N_06985 [Bryobacteraceae bacterium]
MLVPLMNGQSHSQPFDTIESAQEFLGLLHQSIRETLEDMNQELGDTCADRKTRRAQAIELTIFKLNLLRTHIHASEQISKELRTLRDMLCGDVEQGVAVPLQS